MIDNVSATFVVYLRSSTFLYSVRSSLTRDARDTVFPQAFQFHRLPWQHTIQHHNLNKQSIHINDTQDVKTAASLRHVAVVYCR